MRALLDVNVLVAWLDRQHEHHEIARRWLEDNVEHGWATCAISQNGCMQVMSRPGYPRIQQVRVVADLLQEATDTVAHEFWADASILAPGVIDWQRVQGHKQVTDLHLLALAAKNDGRLVTFDRRIAKSAVLIASDEAYCVLPTA